ncbi:MAG: response regulator [Pseudomonadota bacterium]
MANRRVLIVEDEPKLAQLLADYLNQAGYGTHCLDDGLQVVDWVKLHQPALILLDIMLPGRDGMSLCQDLRDFSKVPIIMLTARVEEIDRLMGLELGADDYICKPFSPREVVARVKAMFRRMEYLDSPPVLPGLILDDTRLNAVYEGQDLNLTAVEYQLLKLLVSEPGRIYSRTQLMEKIYRDNRVVSERTIDSHVKKLRKKISTVTPEQALIHAVYSVGYKFEIAD